MTTRNRSLCTAMPRGRESPSASVPPDPSYTPEQEAVMQQYLEMLPSRGPDPDMAEKLNHHAKHPRRRNRGNHAK